MSKQIKSRSTGKFENRTCEVCGVVGAYPAIKRHQIARHKDVGPDWRTYDSHAEDDNTKRIRGFFLPIVLNGAVSTLIEGRELTPAEKGAITRAKNKAAGFNNNPGEGNTTATDQDSTEAA